MSGLNWFGGRLECVVVSEQGHESAYIRQNLTLIAAQRELNQLKAKGLRVKDAMYYPSALGLTAE